jgi:Nucleotidyl transferase of unknown function (DUF2204)
VSSFLAAGMHPIRCEIERSVRLVCYGGGSGMARGKRRAALTGSLRKAVNAVSVALTSLPIPGMVIGGIGVIARGVPRATRDVDITLEGGKLPLETLVGLLDKHEITPRIDDAVGFARDNHVLLLRHVASGVDIDVSIASLPFELAAISNSELVDLDGCRVRVATAEDLIIYKAIAFRPQDQQDIERLITLHGGTIDLARVRAIVAQFAEALDEPDRVLSLERLLEGSA